MLLRVVGLPEMVCGSGAQGKAISICYACSILYFYSLFFLACISLSGVNREDRIAGSVSGVYSC